MADLEIKDFSGGMSDQIVGADPRLSAKLWNRFVDVDLSMRTRPGSLVDGATDTINKLTSGVEELLLPLTAGDKPYKLSTGSNKGKLFYFNGTTHVELTGPTSNSLFTTAHGLAGDHQFVTSRWVDHIFITSTSFTQKMKKVYQDSSGALQLRNASLPKYSGTPTWTDSGTAGSYLYALVWKHSYKSGNKTIVDRSAPFFVATARAFIATSVSCTVGSLSNSGGESYFAQAAGSEESMTLELYRTTTNGTTFYLAGSSDYASPTVVADGTSDATLITRAVLYTGSQVARDESPISKFFHVTQNGVGIYGYLTDTNGDTLKNRVGQSVPGVPGSQPGTFFDDADDEIAGVSSYQGVPIVFGLSNIYRGEGQIEPSGTGVFKLKKIVNGIGCLNHNSIVQTFAGVFFAASSGFYWTDGYQVKKISDSINSTFATAYSTVARKRACKGAFDETNLRVHWTGVDTTTSDLIFTYHLRFGVKEQGVFSIWGGYTQASHEEMNAQPSTVPSTITQNFQAKCLLYASGVLYRGDNRGYSFYFDQETKTDPRVVTSANISAWGTTYIYNHWRSVALDFGSSLIRKWTTSLSLVASNRGNISVRPEIDRDEEGAWQLCKEIKIRTSVTWGEDGVLWGDPILWETSQSLLPEVRRFPSKRLRCTYRQVGLKNAFTVIQKSDNLGLATVDPVGKTVQLLAGSWPTDVLDYYILLAHDGYSDKFLVTGRSASTLTVSDALNRLPVAGNYAWELKGYAKGQVLDVESVTLPYELLSADSQTLFRTGGEEDNA